MTTRQSLLDQIAQDAAKLGLHDGLERVEVIFHRLSMDEIDTLRDKVRYYAIYKR